MAFNLEKSSNPMLRDSVFENFSVATPQTAMTVRGATEKTAMLLGLVLLAGAWSWKIGMENPAALMGYMLGGMVGGFIFSLVGMFKQSWAPVVAPLYALCEGLFLGGFSMFMEARFPGIPMQAFILSSATLAVLLFGYRTGLIRVTETFKAGVIGATGAIAMFYLVAMVLRFFNLEMPGASFQDTSLISVGISLLIVGVAALNLVLDFDFIDQAAANGAPKYMEWVGAMGLLMTLVWLYVEMVRLLAKLRD